MVEPLDSSQRTDNSRLHDWAVLGKALVVAVVLNAVLSPLVNQIVADVTEYDDCLYASFFGFLFGELLILGIFSALACRNWLTGYFVGVAFEAVILTELLLLFTFKENVGLEPFFALGCVPVSLLALVAPLYVFRHFGRWRLCRSACHLQAPAPQILDLFVAVAIVAAALVLVRALALIWEEDISDIETWIPVLVMCGILFGVGLVVAPPATWLMFAVGNRAFVAIGLLSLTACFLSLVCLVHQHLIASPDHSWSDNALEHMSIASLVIATTTTFAGFGTLLRSSGFQWVRLSGDLPKQVPTHFHRRLTWSTIVATVGVMAVVSFQLNAITKQRAAMDQENQRLEVLAESLKGTVSFTDRKLTHIYLGDLARDHDLEHFKQTSDVMSLGLFCPKMTNAAIAKVADYPQLNFFGLQSPHVTDNALHHLSGLSELVSLNLANTAVKGPGLRPLIGKCRLMTLDLSYSAIDDESCEIIAQFKALEYLSLRGTQITDRGLEQLQSLLLLNSLDLRETSVDGSGIGAYEYLQSLQLSDTFVDDARLTELIRCKKIEVLKLANTAVTDDGIAQLQQFPQLARLDLSQMSISETGLSKLGAISI